jgi:hypothetical protein
METRIHNDLELYGSMTLAVSVNTYPENPKVGTLIIKDNCLYAYISIGGYLTWYPFASKTNSYIHSQGIASNVWTITHNLNTYNTWTQIKDGDGDVVVAAITNTSANVITVTFTTPILGTAIVVGPSTIDVPEMRASLVTIGDGTVVIDSDGIRIAGQNVLTSANIATEISSSISSVIGSLSNLTTTTKSDVVAAINEVKALAAAGTGTPGFTGSAGAAGFTGSAGAAGSNGFTGSAGAGFTGSAGAAGSNGFTGSAGAAGSIGFTGSAGAGFTGSAGNLGFTGSAGNLGFTGSAGPIGPANGYTGSRGFTGSVGFTGSGGTLSWNPQITANIITVSYTSSGNEYSKISGVQGVYDGQLRSLGGYQLASCFAYAGLNPSDSSGLVFGLTTDPSSTSINQFSYGFLVKLPVGSSFYTTTIIENGIEQSLNQLPSDSPLRINNTNTLIDALGYQITYDGNNVNYYASNTLVRSTPRTIGSLLYFNSLFKTRSETLYNVSFTSIGLTGFTGSAGAGFTGSAGTTGFTGSVGFTGSAGTAGAAGSAGSTGFTGSLGFTGSAGIGFTGSAGAAGSAGSTGFTGSAGAGFTGSAGSAGTVGFTGSAGSAGTVGFTGSAGSGFTGSAGAIGFTGSSGDSITSTANITTWTNVPYDIGSTVIGKPAASGVVLRFRAVRAFTIDSTGHQAFADIAATASTVFTVAKNSSSIGTVTFGAGATTSTVSVTSTSFIVGDKLVVTAPASADATLSDIDFSFVAKLD